MANTDGETFPDRGYHVLSVDDAHYIGSDRLPAQQWTLQHIEATRRIDRITYRFDTDAVRITDSQNVNPGELYPCGPGIFGIDLHLDNPLPAGEQLEVGYMTSFAYQEPPDAVFRRRIAPRDLGKLQMSVAFQADQLPRRVFWAEWQGLAGPVQQGTQLEQLLQPIDNDYGSSCEVFRDLTNIPIGKVLGFYWEWE